MGRRTKRTLNKCKSCGDTWYPRGRSLSNKCPNCGSTAVTYHIGIGTWITLAIVGWIVWTAATRETPQTPTQPAALKATPQPLHPKAR